MPGTWSRAGAGCSVLKCCRRCFLSSSCCSCRKAPGGWSGRVEARRRWPFFSRISGRAEAQREVASIEGALAHETGSIRQLFGPGLRVALGIGLALALFQQFSGINAIMYYAPEIFKATGSSVDGAFLQAVSVGTVNLFFTFLAIWLVDRVGRKVLLLAGAAVECLALVGVGYYFHVGSAGWGVLLFVLLYVAAFAATMGPVVWVVISEIFPTKIRGRAMSISIVLLWIACFVVSQNLPDAGGVAGHSANLLGLRAGLCGLLPVRASSCSENEGEVARRNRAVLGFEIGASRNQ